jgi:hypothetical protein
MVPVEEDKLGKFGESREVIHIAVPQLDLIELQHLIELLDLPNN